MYPLGPVAAHVLGFAGLDNRGLSGLELALDKTLAGRSGRQTVVRDPFGRTLDVLSSVAPVEGRNVRLTLDDTLQANAESVLIRTVRQWGAKAATAVVLDPRTGEVLAMASEPGFDANRFPETDKDTQRNRAVTDTYEPGSTLKVVTVAGGALGGLVTPSTPFSLEPSIRVADRVIHEAHRTRTERMTVAEILSRSSNVGTITLAELLGRSRLETWVERFGFGKRSRRGLPGRDAGDPPLLLVGVDDRHAADRPRDRGHAGADGGRLCRGGERRRLAPAAARCRPPCEAAAGDVEGGRGTSCCRCCATSSSKGPAPKPRSRATRSPARPARRRSRIRAAATRRAATWHRSSASFPASAPRLVVLVTVDEPESAIWGGVVAAPAFQQIAHFALQYLEIPPDALPPR